MNGTEKQWYAWVGQNASTGTPNPNTGRMSMYGDNHKFRTRKERDDFVDDYYDRNGNKYAIKCSRQQLRGCNLGMTVRDFDNHIDVEMDWTAYNESTQRWEKEGYGI
jgi:hypothetical protein